MKIANNTCSTSQTLTQLNIELSRQIKTLQDLNINIDSNTQLLAKDGKVLISENLATTNNLNNLTENAKYMVDKIYDEQIGGNSIPLIYATTFKDEIIEYSDGGYPIEPFKQSNMYWKFVELLNTGDYKLIDVSVSTMKGEYRNRYQKPDEIYSQSLLPSQRVRLIETPMDSLKHEPKEATLEPYDMNYYYTEDNGYGMTLNTMYVSWRNLKYEYSYEVKNGLEITFSDYYVYNNKRYATKEALYTAIMQERKLEKQKRIKLIN